MSNWKWSLHRSTVTSHFILWVICLVFVLNGCNSRNRESPLLQTPLADAVVGSEIRPIPESDLDNDQKIAQRVAVASAELRKNNSDPQTGQPLRMAVFGAYPLVKSDITNETQACQNTTCYRIELYNFATNITHLVVVDLDAEKEIYEYTLVNTQPEIPKYLTKRAVEIATSSAEVKEALGFDPAPADATMPNIKTALNKTSCEKSRHLCVAPTFLVDQRALWAIVDLTDERLVGVRWTDLGASSGENTEATIINEKIYTDYCANSVEVEQDGWKFNYILTSSDGLRIADATYNGQPVFRSAKLVDWHVSYSSRDGFGYSDSIGCPIFSQAAVGLSSPPLLEPIEKDGSKIGIQLSADYRHPSWPDPCNYRYEQRFEFYTDGSFRIVAGNHGRGCGNDATYRPVLRLDWGVVLGLAEWDGNNWQPWETERWAVQSAETPYTAEGYQYKLSNTNGIGYYLEPSNGQFNDGGRGDHAFIYAAVHKSDEGDADLVTIGPCCNNDYQQGPEKFINDESLLQSEWVLWYVPKIENEDDPTNPYCWADKILEDGVYRPKSWPCYVGPRFIPIK